jgi:hypothetical protein
MENDSPEAGPFIGAATADQKKKPEGFSPAWML